MRGDAEVAGLTVQLGHLLFRRPVSGADGGDQQLFAETDLHRLKERRESSLNEICDRLELVHGIGAVNVGQDANELVSTARGLHAIKVCGQLAELHGYSS